MSTAAESKEKLNMGKLNTAKLNIEKSFHKEHPAQMVGKL